MLQKVLDALASDRFELALVEAKDAVARFPDMAEAYHLLAVAKGALGQFETALVSIDRAIELSPDSSALHVTRGSLLVRSANSDGAEVALREAINLNPNALAAYVSLAHIAIARGDFEQAQQHTTRAALIEPEAPDVLILRGIDAQSRDQLAEASSLFAAAVAVAPDNALAQARLGSCFLAQGHHAFAEQALSNAVQLQPHNRNLRWDLLRALTAQERGEDALRQLDILVEQRPSDAVALSLRSEMLLSAGRMEEAAQGYAALLELAPDHPLATARLVQAWRAMGRHADAVALLEQRLRDHPERDEFWVARLGIEGLDLDVAAQITERWYAARPDSALALQAMAQLHELRGDLTVAESYADRAIAAEPSVGAAQLVKLRAELRQHPDRALARTRRMIEGVQQGEARRSVLHWHGLALDAAGHQADAVAAWREMWQLSPSALPLPGSRALLEQAPSADDTAPVTLLWTLPGAPAEALIAPLALTREHIALTDRFSVAARRDGLDPFKQMAADEGAVPGTYAAWLAAVQGLGVAPERVIDWLPHWDRVLQSQFPASRLIVLLRDPRDLLLNWLAFGSAHQYSAADVNTGALWLQHVLEPLLAFRDAEPARVLMLRGEEAEHDRAATLARITEFSGIAFRDQALLAQSLPHASGRVRSGFPAGHWKAYAPTLVEAFAGLQPLAQALGYEADPG